MRYVPFNEDRASLIRTSVASGDRLSARASGESMPQLEPSLQSLEREVDAAIRSVGAALKEMKKVKTAAELGQLRELRQSLDNATRLAGAAADAVADVRGGWVFDEQQHFASGAYTEEVLALARAEGVQAFDSDKRILCYPVVVSVSPSDTSVSVDRKRDRRVRPSFLVRTLKALQSKPPRFKAVEFLESLAAAYDFVVAKAGRPGVVKLVDLHAVLTVMPGAAREYTGQEFARDLYLLDESGVTVTRDGREMTLPASGLTKGAGVLTTVTRSGQVKVYAGVQFSRKP